MLCVEKRPLQQYFTTFRFKKVQIEVQCDMFDGEKIPQGISKTLALYVMKCVKKRPRIPQLEPTLLHLPPTHAWTLTQMRPSDSNKGIRARTFEMTPQMQLLTSRCQHGWE